MTIEIPTQPSYSERYGRPYIAVVSYRYSAFGDAERWGEWHGEHGQAGVLRIEAEPGDVIMTGRSDSAGSNRQRRWYLMDNDGTLRPVRREDGMFEQRKFQHETTNYRS